MPTITVFGQTIKSKKHLVLLARGLQNRGLKVRAIADGWDGESDLVIDDTSVVIDDIELADLSAETIESAWAARVAEIEAENKQRIEEQQAAIVAQAAAQRETLRELIVETIRANPDIVREAQAGIGGR